MKFCHLFSFLKIITDCKGKKIYQKLYGVVVIFFKNIFFRLFEIVDDVFILLKIRMITEKKVVF